MYAYAKLSQKIARAFGTSAALRKNHYDALGITPKATQADVKAAYYKLSMVYHPDKNTNSVDAGEKFRDITAAYEVLGNVKLRRMYDKGMIHISGSTATSHHHETVDEDPKAGFYRSRDQRMRPPPPTGKTPIYDFDEWARSHYGATFARDMYIKRRQKMQRQMDQQAKEDVKLESIFGAMALLFMFFLYASSGNSEDSMLFRRMDNSRDPPNDK